ncbi:CopG family transcriptional regulator [Candidatus Bipolaricaulota bacterium]
MSDTEKITINLGPVDLGRIDVLVEQGLYSNRTDAIRTAIRNLLDRHESVIQDASVRKSFVFGVEVLSRKGMEKWRAEGRKVALHIVGSLSIASDVTPELARDTIESIWVRGVFRAPADVKAALEDRTK